MSVEGKIEHSERKQAIHDLSNKLAPERDNWIKKNQYYYDEDIRYMQFLVSKGQRILDLGCGVGRLLASLEPSYGVGIDFSERMIAEASRKYPALTFHVGDIEDESVINSLDATFDVIILSDTIGSLDDCQNTLKQIQKVCKPSTRIIIAYYSKLWEPILNIAEATGCMMPHMQENWLSTDDITNLLVLADYEMIKREWRQLLPKRLLGVGNLINKYVATMPLIRRFCLRNYVVARSLKSVSEEINSATVLIPCRNEKGNIENSIIRLPRFCDDIEIIFVDGHSKDGTLDEIHHIIEKYPEHAIKVFVQDGIGKGDAVRKGFDNATGDVLMILDADLTMPPEDLTKYYEALKSGKAEFINGTRLVYPMDKDAMRFLNSIANQAFSWIFTWLLNQRFTDTLCGTKVLTKKHYDQIVDNRHYFGNFDPFGDFDLIFGASKLNLKVIEVPIKYASRSYGETQISRFRHGLLLIKMVIFAFKKLKAF